MAAVAIQAVVAATPAGAAAWDVVAWAEWGEWAAAWVAAAGGGMGNPGSGVSRQDWDRLAENPKFLRIDQRSDQFVVIDDSDHTQTFYPDGKKHNDKDADGNKISTKASWEGSAFIAETKLPHSEKLKETFRLSEDGKQLHVITRFEASSGNASVSIRRVYDMGKAPAQ
jgi:hypothetical protein